MDGITPISDIGMTGYFRKLFRKIRDSFTTPIIRGVTDERTDEYILSVTYSIPFSVTITGANEEIFRFFIPEEASYFDLFAIGDPILIDLSGGAKYAPRVMEVFSNQSSTLSVLQGTPTVGIDDVIKVSIPVTETLVFSERTNSWTTFLSYNAEWLESGMQSYHTFVDGQMWLHDIGNTDYNTFHDRTFPSEVQVVSNTMPQLTKYWRNIGVKTKFQNVSIEESDVQTSDDQVSRIPNDSFENRENTQWAAFYGEGTEDFILEGDKLRGRWLTAKITYNEPEINEQLMKCFGTVFVLGESGFTA